MSACLVVPEQSDSFRPECFLCTPVQCLPQCCHAAFRASCSAQPLCSGLRIAVHGGGECTTCSKIQGTEFTSWKWQGGSQHSSLTRPGLPTARSNAESSQVARLPAHLARRGRRDGLDGLEGFDGFDGLPELAEDAFSTGRRCFEFRGANSMTRRTQCAVGAHALLPCVTQTNPVHHASSSSRPFAQPTDAAAEPPDDKSLAVTPLAKMGVHSDLSCTGSGMAT